MLLLDRLLPALFAASHKVLLFSQFTTQLDLLQDYAVHLRHWPVCRIDGSVPQPERRAQIAAFNTDPRHKLFLLSTRAGGQGINLAAADTVILFDSDWNPQQDLQAQDRAHRIGQTRPVIVYRLATRGTVEQILLEKADAKRRLEKLVIQKGKFKNLLAPDGANGNGKGGEEERELARVLAAEEDFEAYDADADADAEADAPAHVDGEEGSVGRSRGGEEVLSDRDLAILMDRSEEAYLRAEKGSGEGGGRFRAVQTKGGAGGDGVLASLTKGD